jgi:hypothetical protein
MGATHLFIYSWAVIHAEKSIRIKPRPQPAERPPGHVLKWAPPPPAPAVHTSAAARLKAFCICIHVHQRETTRRNTYTCGRATSEWTNQPLFLPLSLLFFFAYRYSLCPLSGSLIRSPARSPSTLFLLLSLITKPPRACIKQACVCARERDPPTPSPARSFSLARATLLLGSYTHTYKCI